MLDSGRAKEGVLPNLIIMGAQKCGTTSLHYYLSLHPDISMSHEKELNFFIPEMNWPRGVDWYKAQFRGAADIRGEASPNYTMYPLVSGVPERMHAVVPEAKLIYIVRHPLERIISHYMQAYATGFENRSLSEALADFTGANRYVCRSQYYMQLTQFLPFFPRSRILLLTAEELLSHRRDTLKRVFRFLHVDDTLDSAKFDNVRHKSDERRCKTKAGLWLSHLIESFGLQRLSPDLAWQLDRLLCLPFSHPMERPSLDGQLRQELTAYLKEDVDRLKAFAGHSFEVWAIT